MRGINGGRHEIQKGPVLVINHYTFTINSFCSSNQSPFFYSWLNVSSTKSTWFKQLIRCLHQKQNFQFLPKPASSFLPRKHRCW